MAFKTLCEDCNEYLGANYVETFKGLYLDFAHESGDILDGLDRDRNESETAGVERYCEFDLGEGFRPLAFVKQVVSNFCATTAPGSMLDCKDFLLDRGNISLPARYRLHMVVLPKLDGESVFSGWMRVLFDDGTFCDMAFIRMPPFGFVLYDTESSTYLPDRAVTSRPCHAWAGTRQGKSPSSSRRSREGTRRDLTCGAGTRTPCDGTRPAYRSGSSSGTLPMSRIHPSLLRMAPWSMAILPYASIFQHRSRGP